jgi:hypothetical protein
MMIVTTVLIVAYGLFCYNLGWHLGRRNMIPKGWD